jgi:hypothetical protein
MRTVRLLPIIRHFQEDISVINGSSFAARLLALSLAFAVLLVAGVIGPSQADASCRLAGVTVTASGQPEAVILAVEGTPEYQVVPLENGAGLAVVLSDCELADGFQLPSLVPEASISQVEYRLSLLAGTQSVELTIRMRPDSYTGYSVDTSVPGVMRINLGPEAPQPVEGTEPSGDVVQEVQVMHYGPREGDPDAIYKIESINVQPIADGEQVVIVADAPCSPELLRFSYPTRLTFEVQGGYLSDQLDEFLYTNREGLVSKIDVLFSPQYKAGVFQLIISCPDMGWYEMTEDGSTYTIGIHKGEAPETIQPAVETAPAPIETEAVAVSQPETPEAQAPVAETQNPTPEIPAEAVQPPAETEISPIVPATESDGETPTEPPSPGPAPEAPAEPPVPADYSGSYDYPDVPVDTTAAEPGTYDFPEQEESTNSKHVSDAIVSLNVVSAQFVDVMMILAEQAGVNFVLDAYWNIPPTGFIREGFRPPGGPGGGGGSGGFGGGGGFNPREGNTGGSVTMHLSEVPFDTAFNLLMQSNNLEYRVFRYTVDTDPILFISSRERIEQELGLGTIQIYHLSYIDPNSALTFLSNMDLLPTTSGYGFWTYGGGSNNNSGGGGGGFGGGGNRGGGGGGRSGGGFSSPTPGGFSSNALNYGQQPYSYAQVPEQLQSSGGGGVGGGGFGGGGGGGGGGIGGGGGGGGGGGNNNGSSGLLPTAKAGAIGIIATEETHDKIREALLQIDKPPKMIFVESTFLTYDTGDPNNRPTIYGLSQIGDWAFEVGGDRFRGAFDITGNEGLTFEILPKNQRMPFEDFRAMWQYVFSERDAKIISSPRVAVIDGFTATIQVTENQPFIIDGGVVIDQFGNAVPAPDIVTFIPTGTTLTITPYIDDYGNVTMAMNPSDTKFLSAPELINGNLVFGTATAAINTVLRMRDGETIILGGLRTRIHDVTRHQIPLLGDLPLIGPLFGQTTINNTDSNLVIIMTVHLVGA